MLRISMFRALIVSLAISLIAAALVVPAHHAKAAGDCTVDASIDSEEQAFLMPINQYRQQNGRGPLTLSYGLAKPSQWKSVDMAKNKYFAHDDLAVRGCSASATAATATTPQWPRTLLPGTRPRRPCSMHGATARATTPTCWARATRRSASAATSTPRARTAGTGRRTSAASATAS